MFELPMSNMMKLDVLKYNVEFYMTDSRERKRTVSVIIRKRAVMKKTCLVTVDVSRTNGSQLKNPDISGALYTLRIQYSYIIVASFHKMRDLYFTLDTEFFIKLFFLFSCFGVPFGFIFLHFLNFMNSFQT